MIAADAVAKWRQPYQDVADYSPTWAALAQTLLNQGFAYVEYDGLGTDILQRKTECTNLLAQMYGDTVTLYHGATTVWQCYGRAVDVEGLRLLIACAEVEQAIA